MDNEKKSDNGWLIAVVIAIMVLMVGVIVLGAVLGYKLVQKVSEEKRVFSMKENDTSDEEAEDDFDFEYSYQYREEKQSETDEQNGETTESSDSLKNGYPEFYSDEENPVAGNYSQGAFNEDDYSYTDKETGAKYYKELKNAIRDDLNYSVSWQEYKYKTDYENVSIQASYPKLVGENIPNLDYINDYIFDEVEFWTESFEEYVNEGYFFEDDEFYLNSTVYVTYMDEEKISMVYSEYGETDGSTMYYLYSVNVDVQNGVILDNASIINMDDEFAVEFRERNREQNDADGYIDELSDQEIVEYLNSPSMGVVFYTPLGLEVGINLDYGWYTVTFRDYEKYLKKL